MTILIAHILLKQISALARIVLHTAHASVVLQPT